MTKTKKRKSTIFLIISSIILIALIIGIVFAVINLSKISTGYIAFVVTRDNKIINNSQNNEIIINQENSFSVKYVYAEESKHNIYDYDVKILGNINQEYCVNDTAYNFLNNDYTDKFNLVKNENTFTITAPDSIDKLLPNATDKYGNEILLPLSEVDSFILQITAHDKKTILKYKFRICNATNVNVAVSEIITNTNDINFITNDSVFYPIEEIEISETEIIFREVD